MNSYFANPSLSCHLSGGQEVLPNMPLNTTTYDSVRHFSSYGTTMAQNRIYASTFYSPQDNVVFGSSRGPYEYGSNVFLQDKDVLPSCRQTSMGLNAQSHVAQEYSLEQARAGTQEQKGNNFQIYPWMQRMNSHSGEFLLRLGTYPGGIGLFYDTSYQQSSYILWPHKPLLNHQTIKAPFSREGNPIWLPSLILECQNYFKNLCNMCECVRKIYNKSTFWIILRACTTMSKCNLALPMYTVWK